MFLHAGTYTTGKVFLEDVLGSWNPVCFALLIVNSALMALACLVLLRLGELLTGSPAVGLIATYLYLTGWNVVNLTLGGALIDAVEILLLLSLTLSVLQSRWWCVPLLMVVGAFAKETVPLFGLTFCFAMLAYQRLVEGKSPPWGFVWAVLGLAVAVLSLYAVRSIIGGRSYEAHAFSWNRLMTMMPNMLHLLHHTTACSMVPLVALGSFRIRRLPAALLAASLAVALVAVGIAAYADIGEGIGRPLYNTIGPVLSISGALLIRDFWPHS
jgi:hypothetical protein